MHATAELDPGPTIAAQRKAEILSAAARCLVDRGYDRVRLRDVARESGLSIGLIQHYFETRDALLEEAFEALSESLIARCTETIEREHPDPWGRIAGLIRQLASDPDLRRHCAAWSQFCVLAYRKRPMRNGVGRIFDAWRHHIETAIEDGIRERRFHPALPPRTLVDAILALVDGAELSVTAGAMPDDGDRLLELVLDATAVLLGLDPAGANGRGDRKPAAVGRRRQPERAAA